uniref:Uncharacterized protein n=1 Tax=Globisporangium ultimum (strain ATCC 200006 / CBS 805.95 / DAOM BR144) TaxID=431595 RepID=K3WZM3_GLOUD
MRASDLVRVVALYNNTQPHTGVMSLMYLALADVVPETTSAAAAVTENVVETSAAAPAERKSLFARFMGSPLMTVGPVAAALGCAIVLVLHMKKRNGYAELTQASA